LTLPIKNFLKIKPRTEVCHDGQGLVNISTIFDKQDFDTSLQFMHYTVLPPGTSIGLHTHGNDEEVYVILEGSGVMEVDGQKIPVGKGDAVLNKPYATHALYNTSDSADIKILVFEVANRAD